ncbi:MAG: Rpn family recombination-promoting nuclease/putative transposase [Agathobacter sp.]|nr:Rpn family recombination-promoting nuclease/putative transposase [Agathobacter sp.]
MKKEIKDGNTYKDATGEILYNMTNDYMFRVVNQKNPRVTKGIICAILHLKEEMVQSVEITNPIELGEDINDKTFVLDINVLLNNSSIINFEMQVVNEHDWQDRSLSYLCRSFDQLYQGTSYSSAHPAIHVGFLNFQPFSDYPEFHACYKLINEKNGMVYSDKFILNVVDLTHIELSTVVDKEAQLDLWARFFIAKTWEEIIMIAEKNIYIEAAAQTLYEANADETTKMKCRARRDYYKQKNTTEKLIRELSEDNNKLSEENKKLNEYILELEEKLAKANKG